MPWWSKSGKRGERMRENERKMYKYKGIERDKIHTKK
jgi:hypothetical protein